MTAEERIAALEAALALERAKVHELSAALAAAVASAARVQQLDAERKARRSEQNRRAYTRRQHEIQRAENSLPPPPPLEGSPPPSDPSSPSPISSPPTPSASSAAPREELRLTEATAPRRSRRKQASPGETDPRHAPLVLELVEACKQVTKHAYGFRQGQDATNVKKLLGLADQDPATAGPAAPAEVVRRWRIGLAWRWKNGEAPVQDLGALYQRWSACASPATAPPAQIGNGARMSDFSAVLGEDV